MSAELIEALRAGRRTRITLEALRSAWLALHPEQLQHPERDALLLAALESLAQAGELRLPARASYEARGNPRMPRFVTLTSRTASTPKEAWEQVPWLPELGFWTTLGESELHTARAINAWLIKRAGRFLRVPLRERSLEIFDDEKYLDGRVRGDALFAGRLPLRAIGAFLVPHPLPYRVANAIGRPILVVENHHTYWSLAEWNTERAHYAAVVWSSGHALASRAAALTEVIRESRASGATYFGDLDPRGIWIPWNFSRTTSRVLEPAIDLYRLLLEIGVRRPLGTRVTNDEAIAREWIPDLAPALIELWRGGFRIPQESLGTEELMRGHLAAP